MLLNWYVKERFAKTEFVARVINQTFSIEYNGFLCTTFIPPTNFINFIQDFQTRILNLCVL
ncbi:hypothetical protein QTP88_025813 [Uroleucon formosanum]